MLTTKAFDTIRCLREQYGALVPIEDAILPRGKWMYDFCGDLDRSCDCLEHYWQALERCNGNRHCHHVADNGGPLIIPTRSPMAIQTWDDGTDVRMDLAALINFRGAITLKGIQNIGLCSHQPCGMADLFHLETGEALFLGIQAKLRTRQAFPQIEPDRTVCFTQVDYLGHRPAEQRFRTYVLKREPFAEWLANEGNAYEKAQELLLAA